MKKFLKRFALFAGATRIIRFILTFCIRYYAASKTNGESVDALIEDAKVAKKHRNAACFRQADILNKHDQRTLAMLYLKLVRPVK